MTDLEGFSPGGFQAHDRPVVLVADANRVSAGEVAACWALLDADEHARARAFLHEADRRTYVVAHGLLRRFLGALAGCHPASLCFGVEPLGKPFLSGPEGRQQGGAGLSFSLSHSGSLVALAFTGVAFCGVDIEEPRPARGVETLWGEDVLSGEERRFLGALAMADRPAAFLDLWVCKEAALKAVGVGLSGLSAAALPRPACLDRVFRPLGSLEMSGASLDLHGLRVQGRCPLCVALPQGSPAPRVVGLAGVGE